MIRHFFRAIVWVLLRFMYRVRIEGLGNIPRTGSALLTPNHVSYLDAVLIASHIDRPVRFAMYWKLYRPFAFLLSPLGAFPIASKEENPEVYSSAFEIMSQTIEEGGLLCVFPEGQLTRTGEIGEFKGGIRKLLDRQPCRVIPMGLNNLWGSYFSRKKPGLFKLPGHFMAEIEIKIGLPFHPGITLAELRREVAGLVEVS